MITINGNVVEFKKFPNNESLLIKESIGELPQHGYIEFKYTEDGDLIKLMFVVKYLEQIYYKFKQNYNYSLIIYYMPYSRMDRVEDDSAFTLKYVADFINSLGFEKVTIIEPHSNVTNALVNNSLHYNITAHILPHVVAELNMDLSDYDYIMFPDAGAQARYKNLKFKNILVGNKIRDFETGKITGLELSNGDLFVSKGNVLIVDDLCSYGGTFVKSAQLLRNKGFKEIYLLVAHAENAIFKGELFDHVDKVITTNSILTEQDNWENAKFKNKLKIINVNSFIK